MKHYPLSLLRLIDVFRKLPGVGSKSAERFAFDMITWPKEKLEMMSAVINAAANELRACDECGCTTDASSCYFCDATRLQSLKLCIVATARDVFSIEATNEYVGSYHVLGGVLSPMQGIGPSQLRIEKLKERIVKHQIQELVVALDSTLEGDTTALYLKEVLSFPNLNVSRLAFGVPMGSSLDYVDSGTLARALAARSNF